MRWLTDRNRIHVGRGMALAAIAMSTSAFIIFIVLAPDLMYSSWVVHNAIGGVVLAILGWFVVGAQPRNRAAWLFPWIAVFQGLMAVGVALLLVATERRGLPLDPVGIEVVDLGAIGALGAVISAAAWVPGIVPMVTLSLLWFPDGRLPSPSRRWRMVQGLTLVAIASATLSLAWQSRPTEGIVFDVADGVFLGAAFAAIGLSIVFSVIGLGVRYQRSRGGDRRRFRWVAWAIGTMAVLWLAANTLEVVTTGSVGGPLFRAVGLISGLLFYGGYTLAIWRHQLFDVDVVISRTLLFGSLAVFIGAVYVAVVFGVGSLVAQTIDDDRVLSLVATVVVAFLFHPVRQRLERTANRLVYGHRATPYEVLSDLSGRLARAESIDGLLSRMATLMAEGTGAEKAVVWRWSGSAFEPLAVWPTESRDGTTAEFDDGAPAVGDILVPIERAGQQLGALTVTKPRGAELNPTEQRLLDDLAGSAGLVLDQARLDDALSEQAAALVRSRRRLVGAQDDERQRLERQLQAGTQQQLATLAEALEAGIAMAVHEGLDPVAEQLAALVEEIRLAQDEIRTLAQGVYPPILEAEGLAAAVESLSAGLPIPVDVQSTGDGRFGLDIELAVYFCIAEALTNVVKHAQAKAITVLLSRENGRLSFEVTDDGVGFSSTNGGVSGTGLVGLHDRIEAVGGRLSVRSAAGQGTTVLGAVASSGGQDVLRSAASHLV